MEFVNKTAIDPCGEVTFEDFNTSVPNCTTLNLNSPKNNTVPVDILGKVIQVASPLILFISSACCFVVLNTFLKDLNTFIKNILKTLCCHNFITCSMTFGLLLYLSQDEGNQKTRFWACHGIVYLAGTTNSMLIHNIGIISLVRYYIAWKTSNQEMAKKHVIISIATATYLIEYGSSILAEIYYKSYGHHICMKIEGELEDDEYNFFKLVSWIVSSIVIIVVNILLGLFLKEKNKVHPNGPNQVHLVPWKSSNAPKYDYHVPISACLVTVAVWFSFLAWTLMLRYLLDLGKGTFKYALPMRYSMTSIFMPILLILTLRAKKKAKPLPQLPKVLQYHGDDDNSVQNEAGESNTRSNVGKPKNCNRERTRRFSDVGYATRKKEVFWIAESEIHPRTETEELEMASFGNSKMIFVKSHSFDK